jgi:DNA polymerase-3 subunit chi
VTKVNFYRIQGGSDAAVELSCRLADRAWQNCSDILIYATDKHIVESLDERLWSWSTGSFLPHRLSATEGPETITLRTGSNGEPGEPGNHHGLLINLAAKTPDWFGRFESISEVIYGAEDFVEDKRLRYKFYKDRGYPIEYHDMTERF